MRPHGDVRRRALRAAGAGVLVLGLVSPAVGGSVAVRACRSAIGRELGAVARVGLAVASRCQRDCDGTDRGACADVASPRFDPRGRYAARKARAATRIARACRSAGPAVLSNYATGSPAASVLPRIDALVAESVAAVLGAGDAACDGKRRACRDAIARGHVDLTVAVVAGATACQRRADARAVAFGPMAAACAAAGREPAIAGRARARMVAACGGLDAEPCVPFPACVVEGGMVAGRALAQEFFASPRPAECSAAGRPDDPVFGPTVWDAMIVAYEQQDAENPPAAGSVVFTGSSTILLWSTLAADLAPLAVLNRGFGGSVVSQATHYVGRIVVPYAPRAVVLYAGDNDIALGMSADCVREDVVAFVAAVRAALPGLPIWYLSIKKSVARRVLWPEMERANALVAAIGQADPAFHFVDLTAPLLDEWGNPRAEMFLGDGLHLSAGGYAAWTAALRPVLEAGLP